MFSSKPYLSLGLFIILFSLLLLFLKADLFSEKYAHTQEPGFADNENYIEDCSNSIKPLAAAIRQDPALNLLGKNFSEIKEILGEPAEEGSSNWHGPHHYLSYEFEEGIVRFNSPQGLENNTAVSIILNGRHELLCARVGMSFSEIEDVLGSPSLGPKQGLDDLYYMNYYLGTNSNQTPEIVISFSAEKIDGPTFEVFIKWEGFDYERINNKMEFQL